MIPAQAGPESREAAFVHASPVLLRGQLSRAPRLINRRPPVKRFHSSRCPLPRTSACVSADGQTTSTTSLKTLISDAKDLGTVRFIAISDGAVLETIGRFDYAVSAFSVPGKGDYLTLASSDKTFECHINTAKVRAATMRTEPAKIGGHDLHVLRLLGPQDALVLSCLLMWDPSQGPGHYLHGAVDAFEALRRKYGERVALQ